MSFAERTVQREGPGGRRLRFGVSFARSENSILPISRQGIRVGEPSISRGVVRVSLDGLVEIIDSCSHAIRGSFIPKVSSFEIGLVGFRIHALRVLQDSLFVGSQLDPDLLGDGSGDLLLEQERVPQVALIALSPQVLVSSRQDQLRRNSNLVSR